jgi:hypothetical protein
MERPQLVGGRRPPTLKRVTTTLFGNQRTPLAACVEGRNHVGDPPQVVLHNGVPSDQRGQPPVLGHAPHDHQVVAHLTVPGR